MASGESIAAWVDSETKREVERYRERHDCDTLSEAGGDLIEIGLRESSNPIIYRVKDQVIEWVSLLGIAAVLVLLAGATTRVIHIVDAAKLSVALVVVAMLLLGVFEVSRLALGRNEIGSAIRALIGGEPE